MLVNPFTRLRNSVRKEFKQNLLGLLGGAMG
jgi:hypothetical protein